MLKLKEVLSDRTFVKYSLFCAVTAALLCILYFIIKNFHMILGALLSALGSVVSALTPLIIGLILAYLLSPLVDMIDQKIMSKVFFNLPKDPIKRNRRENLRRLISIFVTFILIMVAIFLIIYAFAILIVGQFIFGGISVMVDNIIAYFMNYESVVKEWVNALPEGELAARAEGILNSVTNWFADNFSTSAIVGFIAGIGGGIVNLVLGAIISIYLMKDKAFFIGLWRKLLHLILPQKTNAVIAETLHDMNSVLSQFIRGALLDALIVAILSSIGLSLLGLDFAVFIGCFAGITNVIPYFGPVIGMIPAFIVGAFTEGLSQGALAVVVLLVIQQIDANIIYPKIVGGTTGLHPLFVLLSVTIAGYYGGIIGMIIAVPIAGILQIFILKWAAWVDKSKEKRLPNDSPDL